MYKYCLILLLFFSSFLDTYGQFGSAPPGETWSPHILNLEPTRWTDWSNAGRQGGIPLTFSCYSDINFYTSGTFTEKLKNAISDASNYSISNGDVIVAIKIPEGSFTVTEQIDMKSNIVIKGAGSDLTTLDFQTGVNSSNCFQITNGGYEEITNVTNGQTMGSTSITVADASNIDPGDFIDIRDERSGALETSDRPYMIGQVVQVNSKFGNTLNLADKLSLDHTGYSTKIYKLINPIRNVGFEDIKITRNINDGASGGFNLFFIYAVNCWVKGCEIAYASSRNINIDNCTQITIKGNYIHHAQAYNGSNGSGYGIALYNRTTNCLIEDNLLYNLRHHVIVSTSVNRNVIAYNYTWQRQSDVPLETIGDISLHGNYSHRNLFESNSCEQIMADDWFSYKRGHSDTLLTGNGPYNLFLRDNVRSTNSIKLYGCDSTTIIGSPSKMDTNGWYIPFIINYRGSAGVYEAFSLYLENCKSTYVTYSYWLSHQDSVKDNDYLPDISYYLTEDNMKELFSGFKDSYTGAVYGPDYGWFSAGNCSYEWSEPQISPAENRKSILKMTLNGGAVSGIDINNITSVHPEENEPIPLEYDLSQNYPNPFNPVTIIGYQIPKDGFVTLKIYDALGKEVTTLVKEFKTAGSYKINFNASGLVSGVYVYRIFVNDGKGGTSYTSTRKLVILR